MKVTEPKIIVCCPHGTSGGPELLHQLVHELRKIGRDASIVYYPFNEPFTCPEPYKKYNAPQGKLQDSADSLVIVPEVATWIIKQLKHARVGVWWLSVDNYFFKLHQSTLKDLCRRWLSLIKGRRLPLYRLRSHIHFTQSHYGKLFLERASINAMPLTDYLGDVHLSSLFSGDLSKKENIVVFNPKKGQLQTRALIAAYPDIRFMPIQDMTAGEVASLMGRAKIYVDFGHHPGKDRPPREAAMAGCCVITGKQGSAKYYEDVPIPEKYKLNDSSSQYIKEFGLLAKAIFADFNMYVQDFDCYRAQILKEPEIFRQQVREIFE